MKAFDDTAAIEVESLIRELGDAHKTIQRRAIDQLVAIAASGDPLVIEKLRASMAGSDRRVRWAAAYALAQIGAEAFAMDSANALCASWFAYISITLRGLVDHSVIPSWRSWPGIYTARVDVNRQL